MLIWRWLLWRLKLSPVIGPGNQKIRARRGFCLLSPSVPRPYHQARLVIHASELSMWVSSSIRNHCPGLIRRRRPKVSILRHVKLGEEITYEEVYPFEYRSGHNDCLP